MSAPILKHHLDPPKEASLLLLGSFLTGGLAKKNISPPHVAVVLLDLCSHDHIKRYWPLKQDVYTSFHANTKLYEPLSNLFYYLYLAGVLAVTGQVGGRVCAAGIAQALSNGDKAQVVALGPVDQPRSQLLDGGGVGLVHEGNVAVTAGTGLLEALLAGLHRLSVPVTRVDVVGDDLVAQVAQSG